MCHKSLSTTFAIQATQNYANLLMDSFNWSTRNWEKFLGFSTAYVNIGKTDKNIQFLFSYYLIFFFIISYFCYYHNVYHFLVERDMALGNFRMIREIYINH